MFYDEEEGSMALKVATGIFGPVAQYTEKVGTMILIESNKFGKIWYGEIDFSVEKIKDYAFDLAKSLQCQISITDMINNKLITTASE